MAAAVVVVHTIFCFAFDIYAQRRLAKAVRIRIPAPFFKAVAAGLVRVARRRPAYADIVPDTAMVLVIFTGNYTAI